MTAEFLVVRVAGLPVQQGSKKLVRNRKKDGTLTEPRMVDDNSHRLMAWRREVAKAAAARLPDGWTPVDSPLQVVLQFAMPRPASAPKRRRTWPVGRPDLDKLARAVLDALTTAQVWRDDSRVVELIARKDYPGPDIEQTTPGVLIAVRRLVPPDHTIATTLTQEGLPIP